ncbi:EamA family transporter RarD [Desulfovibrio psychrotolerans]|uniref:Chloramphenicol resistance permease RarD n=1 Tax=Desulfovibrio psychrotolerans TaxID=415242 RepID=A0A7J0BVR3_9BACT|nr:EamA family transporter RarD [Desulfovibrio psychrotolerans]GFM37261.1 chloramphenicol resistance permease RarD [Desulfovibrio psychrotolerans]
MGYMTDKNTTAGVAAAGGAFVLWGLLPLYWQLLHNVPATEILCHRIAWSVVFVGILLTCTGRWHELRTALHSKKTQLTMTCSSILIGVNWWLYIWAVNNGRVLETSLGYYINPLVNVLLGFVFFRERLRPWQKAAILLAGAGVVYRLLHLGELPWVALTLAFSFSLYGLLRKVVHVESIPGLMFETLLLTPVALGYLIMLHVQGTGVFGQTGTAQTLLLMGAGITTSLPLVGFAFGARRIRLATLGLLQYAAPSIAFLLGVFVFKEEFTTVHLVSFVCIWTALALYTAEGLRAARR